MDRYSQVQRALGGVADEAERVEQAFANAQVSTERLPEAVRSLRLAEKAADDPGEAGPVVEAARELKDQLRTVVLAGAATPDQRTAVTADLDRGAVVSAANLVLSTRRSAAAGGTTTRLGEVGAPTVGAADVALGGTATLEPPLVVLAARTWQQTALRPGPITLGVTGVVGLLLHLLLSVVVVLFTAYALFLPTWTGTFADVVQVITWAFAVDLSLAGLTALVAARAPTAPA